MFSLRKKGIALIELILFIIIISIALSSLLMVFNINDTKSVDPMIYKQAMTIADSLLEEIELHSFSNPTGGFTGSAIQANRALFDDVSDYNGFSTTGVYLSDGSNTVISGLGNYNVSVAINTISWVSNPNDTKEIIVTVTHPDIGSVESVGYRVNY